MDLRQGAGSATFLRDGLPLETPRARMTMQDLPGVLSADLIAAGPLTDSPFVSIRFGFKRLRLRNPVKTQSILQVPNRSIE
jgi:hypothetical protein